MPLDCILAEHKLGLAARQEKRWKKANIGGVRAPAAMGKLLA
jgi:hypothetical protein